MLRQEKGFTILETIVAAAVFMVITLAATNLLIFTSVVGNGLIHKQEYLENARAALDIITANAALAREIKLETNAGGTLKKMVLYELDGDGVLHPYEYTYDAALPQGHVRYHRLEQGGNELASYLQTVNIQIREGVMWVELTTDPVPGQEDEQISLRGTADVKHKKISWTR